MEDVIQEVKGLAQNGYREVVLSGIHLSSYGMERENDFSGSRLLQLIQAVWKSGVMERIRLGSLEPRIITEEFVQGLKDCAGLCPHFHLSLQSGCDMVLKRMNRKYSAREYYEKVCLLRKHFDAPAITTDVIVGFPGETEDEFEETVGFLRQVGFYEMHIFKYSQRKGTPAAAMEGQIPESIKTNRSSRLLSLGREMSGIFREHYLHKKTEVLFEEEKIINGVRYQVGHTKEYIRGAVKTDEQLTGRILTGQLTDFLEPDILLFCPQIH